MGWKDNLKKNEKVFGWFAFAAFVAFVISLLKSIYDDTWNAGDILLVLTYGVLALPLVGNDLKEMAKRLWVRCGRIVEWFRRRLRYWALGLVIAAEGAVVLRLVQTHHGWVAVGALTVTFATIVLLAEFKNRP